ncbi:hypothetical protein GGQ72_003276 [Rhizobium rhizoryzae]|uniref:Uncharacterized protein n=1 Tax=Rhizobium rhizoryzae TaxID=451876 RepID=A0A7W6PS80_9HYPH|nr:hypothetical protein [Rhizobium rhizoryzae]
MQVDSLPLVGRVGEGIFIAHRHALIRSDPPTFKKIVAFSNIFSPLTPPPPRTHVSIPSFRNGYTSRRAGDAEPARV